MFIIFAFVALSAAVEYNKAKYLVQKDGYEKKVIVLNKCSPSSDQKTRTKYEGESATKYKKLVYAGDDTKYEKKETSSESLDVAPTEGTKYEYVETLPDNVAHKISTLSEDCVVQIENELTIYVSACLPDTTKENCKSAKVVVQPNNLFEREYYTDTDCKTPSSAFKDDLGRCGSCKGSPENTYLKCEKYPPSSTPSGNNNGSIQTFVLFALTILLFLF